MDKKIKRWNNLAKLASMYLYKLEARFHFPFFLSIIGITFK